MKELPEGLDINQLWATGNSSQINMLLIRLLEQFRNKQFAVSDLVHNMIADPTSTLKLSYLSTGGFPEEKFQWITSSMLDTAGLNIRVMNDEIACGYKKEYLFRDGKWCFENPPGINAQIHQLTQQGLDKIREYLKENGRLYTLNEDDFWIALYVDNHGDGTSSLISSIKLEHDEKVSLNLEDGYSLYEEDLTTNHVLDILTIIEEGHGTYSK
ncbi:hypothetical protein [Dysgonomonas termitidis]|uniref:Uncharacterized protein n=1 Tax=Dysgonomonas termitidis TaxID=1516126 RepID=A0ABV9KR74_9BACT